MPKHFHGILEIVNKNETTKKGLAKGIAPTVGDIIGAFKSITSVAYIRGMNPIIGNNSINDCGNGIIGSISFVTTNHLTGYQPTLRINLRNGIKISLA